MPNTEASSCTGVPLSSEAFWTNRYLHFLLLCSAITLFLGLSITEDDVRLGEEMIYIYLRMYPHLYSKRRRHFLGGMQPGH